LTKEVAAAREALATLKPQAGVTSAVPGIQMPVCIKKSLWEATG